MQSLLRSAFLVLVLIGIAGCETGPQEEVVIPLPGFGDEGPAQPKGVYAVIRRADVPLDQPTDDAWSIINEQIVPPVTRGAWRGNGLRLGLLPKDQLDAYSEAMPKPVAFSKVMINRSGYSVPIIETARLRKDVLFEVDLTRPPRPRQVEKIRGGEDSTLRLLARIESETDGRHTLVLTPQHYIPSPFDLVPRDPLEKEMDGRVFEELTVRLTPGPNQIAVVGLHWPWPITEVIEEDTDPSPSEAGRITPRTIHTALPPADSNDPAAPPPHLSPAPPSADDQDNAQAPGSDEAAGDTAAIEPSFKRLAPPMATDFGSTLLTATRIRQPVRAVLLITIEQTPDRPADDESE